LKYCIEGVAEWWWNAVNATARRCRSYSLFLDSHLEGGLSHLVRMRPAVAVVVAEPAEAVGNEKE